MTRTRHRYKPVDKSHSTIKVSDGRKRNLQAAVRIAPESEVVINGRRLSYEEAKALFEQSSVVRKARLAAERFRRMSEEQ